MNLILEPNLKHSHYDWQNGEQRYKGERVTRNLNITINDLDKVADLMQALGLATQDAKEKAEYLAKQLDRDLGDPISITEQNIAPLVQAQQFDTRSKSASFTESTAPPSERFGTQKIEASVNIRFKLD